jgi:hypothetical protein
MTTALIVITYLCVHTVLQATLCSCVASLLIAMTTALIVITYLCVHTVLQATSCSCVASLLIAMPAATPHAAALLQLLPHAAAEATQVILGVVKSMTYVTWFVSVLICSHVGPWVLLCLHRETAVIDYKNSSQLLKK